MKYQYRIILTLVLLLAILTPTQAQINMFLGGGSNFSKMRKTYAQESFSQDDNLRPGFNLGLFFEQEIKNKWNIESALVYDTKGYISHLNDANNTTERLKTHYINFYPILAKYFYPINDRSRLYAKTGPCLGIGVGGKHTFNGENGYFSEEINWAKLELERIDFLWDYAIGYDFNKAFQVEMAYDMGIRNITDNTNEYLTLRNHCFKITAKVSLTYLFAPVMKDGKFINKKKKEAEVLE